jgi:hypothetical protein
VKREGRKGSTSYEMKVPVPRRVARSDPTRCVRKERIHV